MPTFLHRIPAFLLLGVLCLLHSPLWAQEAAAEKAAEIVTHIERKALQEKYKLINPSGVDGRGLHFEQPKLDGLSQNFFIGAHASPAQAERVWREWPAPQNVREQKIEGVGGQAKAWRWNDEEYYHVVLQRDNVTAGFDWRGLWSEALAFARELDVALQNDRALAPRGPLPMTPLVELAAPALLAAGEPLPILYRTANNPRLPSRWSQPSLITMATLAQISGEQAKPTAVDLTPTPKMNLQGRTQTKEVLTSFGAREVTLTFVTYGGTVFHQSVSTRVFAAQELQGGEVWPLPEKAIFFAPTAGAKWSEMPEDQREQIRLEHERMHRYGSVVGEEIQTEMKRLRAWNEIAATLRPEWLPPREAVQVFRNQARPEYSEVSYAAYQHGDYRLIWMSEIGLQSWLYIEWAPPRKDIETAALLLPDLWKADEKSGQNGRSGFLTHTFDRHRALAPDAAAEPVRVLLLHVGRPAQVHLNFPGYS